MECQCGYARSESTVLCRHCNPIDQIVGDDGTRAPAKVEESTRVAKTVALDDGPPGVEATLAHDDEPVARQVQVAVPDRGVVPQNFDRTTQGDVRILPSSNVHRRTA